VDAALTLGISRILYVSSVAALGRQKHQTLVTEENKWIDSPLNSVYAQSKYRAELEVFRGQEEGLSTVVINPSVILSRGDWTRSSAKIFKYVWDEKPFYTDGSINCVDVRDLTDIIIKLYHSPIEGERFIVNGTSTSFKKLLDMTAQRLNRKGPSIKLTRATVSVLAKLESIRSRITGTEPLITRETARFAGANFLYTNEKVKKALGYQFQTIDATLDWCCEFYRNQKLKIN
jgi:nucleoside-diphosphate-sugar epimerase